MSSVSAPARSQRSVIRVAAVTGVIACLFYGAVRTWGEAWFTPATASLNDDLILAAPAPLLSAPASAAVVEERDVWPNLFGPTHDSVVRDGSLDVATWGPAGPAEVWRVPCGLGYSSPVVWKDRLVLLHRLGDEEVISCLNAADGSPLWEHRYSTAFACGSHYTSGPYSTPATDGEFVFALGAEGRLHCLRMSDGSLVWERDLSREFAVRPDLFGAGHSPLLWEGKLILNVGGKTPASGVIAFDQRTGDVLWRATDHEYSYATPQPAHIHGRDLLFVLTGTGLVLLDPHDGREFWTMPYQTIVSETYAAVTPLVHGDLVLVSILGVGTRVVRIRPDLSCETVWESPRNLTSQYTPLLCVDGFVYGVHAVDDSLRCIDLATGRLKWRRKSELGNAKGLRLGDRLLLFGEYGHLGLVAANSEEYTELALTSQGLFGDQRCYSAPACVQGRLYLRNEEHAACFDLRGRAASSGERELALRSHP